MALVLSVFFGAMAFTQHQHQPHSNGMCSPLLPTAAKLRALDLHRHNDSVALAMWRVMKSATSSACVMMVHEYCDVRKLPAKYEGACGGPWRELFDGSLEWRDVHLEGYSFVGLEPAVQSHWFPLGYQQFAAPYLDPNGANAAQKRVWDGYVHMLTVRHPFKRAMSAFNFRHAAQHDTIGVCRQRNVTNLLACFERCLHLCESGRDSRAYAWFAELRPATANMISTQVCGNFLVEHLSHNGSLEVARGNLRRFSLLVDLDQFPIFSSTLLECVLGWARPNVPQTNVNKMDASLYLDIAKLSAGHLRKMHRLMADDLVLYDEALVLFLQHHRSAIIELYRRQDPEVAQAD
jgi:hypothetical protein